MVDFKKMLEQKHYEKSIGVTFVGYCKICDTKSKLYEENIVRTDVNEDKDLFRCPKCNAFNERQEMIPF